jgi:Glycosyltransferase
LNWEQVVPTSELVEPLLPSRVAVPASRVRILYVHSGDNLIRGSERVLLDLVRNLDSNRFEPIVWCDSPALADKVRTYGVTAYQSRFCILLGRAAPWFDVFRYSWLIRTGLKIVKRHDIRLIHANAGGTAQWTIPLARTARVPMLVHLHVLDPMFRRYKLGLHQAPLTVGCSKAVVRPLIEDGVPEARTRVIYNGLNPLRLEGGDAGGLRASLGIKPAAVVATAVAALIRLKGLDLAIRALTCLPAGGPEMHLIIVGEGEERQALERLARRLGIQQRVHLIGQRSDVGAIYRDATDIAVLPSRREAFALAAAEAGLERLPVVAARVGGIEEVVLEGKTGLLVKPESPSALAQALHRLALQPEERRRMGKEARAWVLNHFTLDRMMESFQNEYERMVSEPAETFGWRGPWTGVRPYWHLFRGLRGRAALHPEAANDGNR